MNTPSPQQSATPSEADSEGVFVPVPESEDTAMKIEYGEANANVGNEAGEERSSKADYVIVDRFHTVGAFKIVSYFLFFPCGAH